MQRFEFNNGKVIVDGVELKHVQSVALLINVGEQPSIIVKMFADPDNVVVDCEDGCIDQQVFDINAMENERSRHWLSLVFRKLC